MIREFEALGVNNEIYVLVYFNVNLLFRDKYVFNKTNEAKKIDKDLLPEIKSTRNFLNLWPEPMIDCPTRITCKVTPPF